MHSNYTRVLQSKLLQHPVSKLELRGEEAWPKVKGMDQQGAEPRPPGPEATSSLPGGNWVILDAETGSPYD